MCDDDGVMIERSSKDEDEASELGIYSRIYWDGGKELWQKVERAQMIGAVIDIDTVWRISPISFFMN